ncbi:MAG TPA: hypothetical protein PLQ41_07190 [bacterium]|nr:hypothetical protein [bacterium]
MREYRGGYSTERDKRMKFRIHTGLFQSIPMEEGLAMIKEAGYDGVEWTWRDVDVPVVPVSGSDRKRILKGAEKIRRMSEKSGLEVISVAPDILPNFADDPEILRVHFEGIMESGAFF